MFYNTEHVYAKIYTTGNEKYIIFGNKSTPISATTKQHYKNIDLFFRFIKQFSTYPAKPADY